MMKFNVKLDIARARRDMADHQKEVNKGAARALTRVAITGRKVADQDIRQRVTLSSATVKKSLEVKTPHGERTLIRDIVATGKPIPLRDYKANRHQRKGVTFAVVRGKRKAFIQKGQKGFIVDRIGGHVFVRTAPDPPGPERAPIQKVYGPSITQRFRVKKVQTAMDTTMRARWPIEFDREMKYRVSKGR